MSKNKLHILSKYEADRLNRIAFMPDERKNLFVWAGSLNSAANQKTFGNNTTGSILSGYNTNSTGIGSNVFNSTPAMQQAMNNVFPTPVLQDYTATPFQRRNIGLKVDNVTKTTFSDNDGKTFSIKEAFGKDALKAAGKTALNAGIGIAGQLVGQGAKAAISGGRSSDIGNGISSLGSTIGGAVGTANPLLGAAITAGSGVLGGLWNGAFGAKWNKENIADVENNIAQMRATDLGSVNSNAALLDAWGQVNLGYDFDQNYIGKNGWLNHKATRKYNKLNAMQQAARAYVQHQLGVAADQADRTQDDLAQSTFIYSDGGFLDNLDTSDMGSATKYSLAQDYLTIKNNKINTDAKIASMYAGTPSTFFGGGSDNTFASGGKIHINPKNKGKFNATKKRTGKTTEELTHSKNPLTRKRAIFAQNAKKWKHPDGGPLWTNSVGVVGPGGFIPKSVSGYSGGAGGGAGAGTIISDIPEYETTAQNDTIWVPVERTFNDAFRDAARRGLSEFTFNGGTYPVEYGDNPNWETAGNARKEVVDLLPLILEKKKTERKKAEGGNLDLDYNDTLFAFGGDMQTNGGDFSTGLSHINAGLSHELNPNEGVQVGVDSQGIPNLVEEGEVIWNDYVFSARIGMDNDSKEVFHINKKRDITYADQAKRLEREIKERPNDPISKAAFNAQMEKLQEQQERQKTEMEAQRAQEAFAALSPEEQTAVMQQVAQQEQAAQDAAMQEQAAQEQAIAEQQAMQGQPTPEEAQMMQQQQMTQEEPQMEQQQVTEPQTVEQPVMACGGHMYDKGGELKKAIYKLIGKNTDSEYRQWLKDNHIEDIKDAEDWENILNNEAVIKAIAKTNPAAAHAISNHYDFGMYRPDNIEKATIQSINKGNWKKTNGLGWLDSEDLAYRQATEGMSEDDIKKLTTEQLADLMRNTDAYKNTSKWLENSDNALLYLNTLLNDDETPEVAKQYARKFVTDGKWKDGFNYDYATVFGSNGKGVRETYPGTYWHSVLEANRGNIAKNFVVNDDGTVEEIVGDVPTDWTNDGSYSWATPENDNLYNYYRRPATTSQESETPVVTTAGDGTPVTTKPGEPTKKYAYRPNLVEETNLGMYGPLVNLGMMAAGIGKPDYTELDKALAIANRPVKLASYQPIGDYIKYRPMDIWAAQNRMDANARATDRAIMNSASPSNQAALLANAYTSQLGSGELFRQSLEYNDNLKKQVADFNRGTNIQNANAFNQLSQFNTSQLNADKQRRAYMAANIAGQKMDADASWYNSLYGNVNSMFTNIANREREIRDRNWMAKMAADGLLGNLGDSYTGQGLITKYEVSAKDGGKLRRKKNKKKGLTI